MLSSAVTSTGRTSKAFLILAVAAVGLLGGAPALLADDGDTVLARVNGRDVTKAEILEILSGELLKLDRQRHDLIQNTVTGRVQEILAEREAERRGLTKDELMKAEVQDKLATVPAEEVDAFYTARRIRQPKEQVEGQIRQYLAYQSFISALEAKAEIEILAEPFRVAVAGDGPSKGKAGAPVKIVEFGDFECPPCGQAYPVLKKVHENYPDKVQVVFRQFPLRSIHPNAQKAGEASLCAHDQGKFWEMHDKMFENQRKLSVDGLKGLATEIAGLDATAFNQCLDEGRHAEVLDQDMQDGSEVGVSGTPAFFVNGRFISGVPSYEALSEIIDEELKDASGP